MDIWLTMLGYALASCMVKPS